jgi:hypothetical protein
MYIYDFLGELAPPPPQLDWKPPRENQTKKILGLAAAGLGYALGGLPGAALGTMASLLVGRNLDETRVG